MRYSFSRRDCCTSSFVRSLCSSTRMIFVWCSTTSLMLRASSCWSHRACLSLSRVGVAPLGMHSPTFSTGYLPSSGGCRCRSQLSEAAKGGSVTAGCKRGKRSSLRSRRSTSEKYWPERRGRVIGSVSFARDRA